MVTKLNGVSFSYRRRTRVLHDVGWVARTGVTGLVGPNGSGKTTLLSVLIGLLRPSEGAVIAFVSRGDDTAGTEADRRAWERFGRHASAGLSAVRFGYWPQRLSMPGEIRVADAVASTAWVNGLPPRACECEPAAVRALAAAELTDKADAKVKTLCGGQSQRAGIVAGVAHEPDVLVLDESTVRWDPEQRWRVREVIAR